MRQRRAVPKTKVTLAIDPRVWPAFHEASIERKLTASEQVEKFMSKRLAQWGKKEKAK